MHRLKALLTGAAAIGAVACGIRESAPTTAQFTASSRVTTSAPFVAQTLPYTAPPLNASLANSPWPIFHRGNYMQASSPLRGPEPSDQFLVQYRATPRLQASPWTVLGERYPSGERPVYGANSTHLFKGLAQGSRFEVVSSVEVNPRPFALNWNLAVLPGNRVVLPDRERRRFLRFADRDPGVAASPLKLEAEFKLPPELRGESAAFVVSYDGYIVFLTDDGMIAALRANDFGRLVTFDLKAALGGEFDLHNNYPMDERGGLYFTTGQTMVKVRWTGNGFNLEWSAPYDFRGPGCPKENPGRVRDVIAVARGQPCTGSGSTPTLVGTDGMDKLVVVTDGHQPKNHMVAFWRDEIPADWRGLPGFDRRVAAVTALPYSTPDGPGFSNENSPTASGYEIASAQWNGFAPPCDPVRGVQKLRWDPATRTMPVVWATDRINFNNVLTYSAGSGLVYGSGRRGCTYYFWGLDWRTGEVRLEIPLGDDARFLDQGNSVTLDDDRSVYFGSARGIVRVAPRQP
jgi:hypothetical protein